MDKEDRIDDDYVAAARERFQNVVKRIFTQTSTVEAPKKKLFPNVAPLKNLRLRPSMIDRACKSSVVSSTPMPTNRLKPFISENSVSVSPISQGSGTSDKKALQPVVAVERMNFSPAVNNSVIELSSACSSADNRNSDSKNETKNLPKKISPCPSADNRNHDAQNIPNLPNKSTMTAKALNLEKVVANLSANTTCKSAQTTPLPSTKKLARSYLYFLEQKLQARQTQTGSSLLKKPLNDPEEVSLKSSCTSSDCDRILDECEATHLSNLKKRTLDVGLPWRVPSTLQNHVVPNRLTLNDVDSLEIEDDVDDTFLPKMPKKKKVFTNKKKAVETATQTKTQKTKCGEGSSKNKTLNKIFNRKGRENLDTSNRKRSEEEQKISETSNKALTKKHKDNLDFRDEPGEDDFNKIQRKTRCEVQRNNSVRSNLKLKQVNRTLIDEQNNNLEDMETSPSDKENQIREWVEKTNENVKTHQNDSKNDSQRKQKTTRRKQGDLFGNSLMPISNEPENDFNRAVDGLSSSKSKIDSQKKHKKTGKKQDDLDGDSLMPTDEPENDLNLEVDALLSPKSKRESQKKHESTRKKQGDSDGNSLVPISDGPENDLSLAVKASSSSKSKRITQKKHKNAEKKQDDLDGDSLMPTDIENDINLEVDGLLSPKSKRESQKRHEDTGKKPDELDGNSLMLTSDGPENDLSLAINGLSSKSKRESQKKHKNSRKKQSDIDGDSLMPTDKELENDLSPKVDGLLSTRSNRNLQREQKKTGKQQVDSFGSSLMPVSDEPQNDLSLAVDGLSTSKSKRDSQKKHKNTRKRQGDLDGDSLMPIDNELENDPNVEVDGLSSTKSNRTLQKKQKKTGKKQGDSLTSTSENPKNSLNLPDDGLSSVKNKRGRKPKPKNTRKNDVLYGNSSNEPEISTAALSSSNVNPDNELGVRRSSRARRAPPPIKAAGYITFNRESEYTKFRGRRNLIIPPKRSLSRSHSITSRTRSSSLVPCSFPPIREEDELPPIPEVEQLPTESENLTRPTEPEVSTSHKSPTKNRVKSGRVGKRASTRSSKQKILEPLQQTLNSGRGEVDSFVNCTQMSKSLLYKPPFKKIDGMPSVSMCLLDDCSLGYLEIKPGQAKRRQKVNLNQLAFSVCKGKAEVVVGDERFIVGNFEFFVVPQGSEYSIKNLDNDKELLLCFTRIKV